MLFSAAVPKQGGHLHVNEQWPGYWADLFYGRGRRVASEELRWEVWDDDEVEPWYRQNMLLFAAIDRPDDEDFRLARSATRYPRAVVHPAIFDHRAR